MADNSNNKKIVLAALIAMGGLFTSTNSVKYVGNLNDGEVNDLLQALTNTQLQPARFVAAVTEPMKALDGDEDTNIEQFEEGIFIEGIDLRHFSPQQLQQLKQEIRKIKITDPKKFRS
jgi:hypothetical protein